MVVLPPRKSRLDSEKWAPVIWRTSFRSTMISWTLTILTQDKPVAGEGLDWISRRLLTNSARINRIGCHLFPPSGDLILDSLKHPINRSSTPLTQSHIWFRTETRDMRLVGPINEPSLVKMGHAIWGKGTSRVSYLGQEKLQFTNQKKQSALLIPKKEKKMNSSWFFTRYFCTTVQV